MFNKECNSQPTLKAFVTVLCVTIAVIYASCYVPVVVNDPCRLGYQVLQRAARCGRHRVPAQGYQKHMPPKRLRKARRSSTAYCSSASDRCHFYYKSTNMSRYRYLHLDSEGLLKKLTDRREIFKNVTNMIKLTMFNQETYIRVRFASGIPKRNHNVHEIHNPESRRFITMCSYGKLQRKIFHVPDDDAVWEIFDPCHGRRQ
ncbi:hypothetical protein COOONC_28708 [Cooperia oncophora]